MLILSQCVSQQMTKDIVHLLFHFCYLVSCGCVGPIPIPNFCKLKFKFLYYIPLYIYYIPLYLYIPLYTFIYLCIIYPQISSILLLYFIDLDPNKPSTSDAASKAKRALSNSCVVCKNMWENANEDWFQCIECAGWACESCFSVNTCQNCTE